MKYLLLTFLPLTLLLISCQSIPPSDDETATTLGVEEEIETADPLEINQALLADESVDVIHPVADGDFSLNKTLKNDTNNADNIWPRIRSQLTFDIPEQPRIISQRNWFLKHPSYLTRVAKRAEPFLYYIVEELEKNNMPLELTMLPVVESAFDPFAYSHGRASGMWQFVPATGERFGMEQNWWYDGRRDVVASTQGAIAYLKYLNKFFDGDWMLALAAYNSGEGRVRNAVRKNKRLGKATDFWSLDLPKETRAYVPKLLALVDIIKRPADFNLSLYPIENKAVLSEVDIESQLDLAKAATLSGLTLAELQRLNPGYNRWATAPKGPHRLLLPSHTVEQFTQGLSQLTPKERLAWERYKIKSGDNLGAIANKFNTRVDLIQKVNNIKGNNIRAGKYLLIPVAAKSLDSYIFSQGQRIAKKQSRPQKGVKIVHIVASGDNLWDIGRKYKVNSKSIAKWNGFAPRDTLKVGQKLVIWQKSNTASNNSQVSNNVENAIMRNITYKVRSGDSFARIADKFNVSIRDIERWNNLNRNKYLQPGQRLKLSVDVTNNI
ncbi:LysM peptidoglycan-binding domain-containing protein [Colwellia sp. E2M01]|uniref:LysM peptidoglycan-binding domain-containing protein n=1 Tax=Colwellia sp. E2M01 TaxID=2841561 RepID=UPI001C0868F4|nr:LysM peptidoglycan-binding domain-containing protein [Colwellia sp. E2M01]MBU2870837.1 LysM peptidoglycan-binding domain-containing protein [Colwellia sp. E2M01]